MKLIGASLALPLALLALVWFQTLAPVSTFTRDPLTVAINAEQCCKAYFGALSSLGNLVWAAAGAVLAFTWLLLRRPFHWIALPAALTIFLTFDDVFFFHEIVLPRLGFSELPAYFGYASISAIYLVVAFRTLRAHRPALFAVAAACLAGSIAVDVYPFAETETRYFVEDGLKFVGICCWATYHWSLCLYLLADAGHDGRA